MNFNYIIHDFINAYEQNQLIQEAKSGHINSNYIQKRLNYLLGSNHIFTTTINNKCISCPKCRLILYNNNSIFYQKIISDTKIFVHKSLYIFSQDNSNFVNEDYLYIDYFDYERYII